MATIKSCEGLVQIDDPASPGTSITVGQVKSWSEEPDIKSEQRYYVRENCNPVNTVDSVTYNLSLEVDTDYADDGQTGLESGEIVTVIIYPEGNTTGGLERTYTGGFITKSESSTAGEVITSSVSVTGAARAEALVP